MPLTLEAAARRSKIVLGVDDEPDNLLMLSALVEGAGYTFMGASSGAQCLTLLTRVQPRLILLDIQMPAIDGFTTCRKIRQYPKLEAIPIVFLTGRKTGRDVRECLAAGGNDYVVKPFQPAKLIERIDFWLARRVAERPVGGQAAG